MRFLCGNLDLKIIIFDYKQRLLVARLRYVKAANIYLQCALTNEDERICIKDGFVPNFIESSVQGTAVLGRLNWAN